MHDINVMDNAVYNIKAPLNENAMLDIKMHDINVVDNAMHDMKFTLDENK